MKLIYLIVFIASLAAIFVYAEASCQCPQDYLPVCSASNRTYSNNCSRGCAGDPYAHAGTCDGSGGYSDY
ncbi:leech-derived tryptase inhibitor C-like [Leguminivora glycinivorella]|uniref:leech-derived tryptase inhibitor C-like n=1 Tax=Leguminivora glycinivorella TaxID=1035111 RepID=UPI00200C5429|nr:leech-derived tryptase inhibitor C-like [Leguminivora glycinivorella]XP_048001308.1 leech-derived tryptase inhibitor C-like [Leguminivora glycinivorella]XP_048006784.1 leech-derived tryptase inhibitor C-like [Leguminivora glycinivorella]